MAKNADTQVTDEDQKVTDEDLRELKYPKEDVENSQNEKDEASEDTEPKDESEVAGEDDGKTDDVAEDEDNEEVDKTESDEESSEFVKEFPNIKGDSLEDYARELEKTLQLSNTEGKRLSDELKSFQSRKGDEKSDKNQPTAEVDVSDPISLFMKQKMDEEINQAFDTFSGNFPQVKDPAEYDKFTEEVAILSQTILNSQKRLASPKELYSKAAVILGWEPEETPPSSKDRLNVALKNGAAISRNTTSSGKKSSTKSKVTDAMVAANRLMYPDKTDAQIREELEPYVN